MQNPHLVPHSSTQNTKQGKVALNNNPPAQLTSHPPLHHAGAPCPAHNREQVGLPTNKTPWSHLAPAVQHKLILITAQKCKYCETLPKCAAHSTTPFGCQRLVMGCHVAKFATPSNFNNPVKTPKNNKCKTIKTAMSTHDLY